MRVEDFIEVLGVDFFTGVPDSQLKSFCDYLISKYGIDSKHHLIAANEGNCVGIAAGYHLATGRVPVVYMQNSGEGNIVNPVTSLLHEKVYAIPMIFVIGWRGEPGIHDEPQHIYQGEITLKILELLQIDYYVIDDTVSLEKVKQDYVNFKKRLKDNKSMAFVIKKNALTFDGAVNYKNGNNLLREEVIEHIVQVSADDYIISTTGKASRELFEIRERNKQSHEHDFLTVGSMGHASSIALGVAINQPMKRIWCIDGDGAMLMHMGAMGIIGSVRPKNMIHVLINNSSHETVGGMPTVVSCIDVQLLAKACGYKNIYSVDSLEKLDNVLMTIKILNELSFIEVRTAIGARKDLGRPTTTAKHNKEIFMRSL